VSVPGTVKVERPTVSSVFGVTGRSFADRPAIGSPVHDLLLPPPGNAVVRTGRGADTGLATRRPDVPAT
jgi:hypothetical protein